jgi:hypothetical protein
MEGEFPVLRALYSEVEMVRAGCPSWNVVGCIGIELQFWGNFDDGKGRIGDADAMKS